MPQRYGVKHTNKTKSYFHKAMQSKDMGLTEKRVFSASVQPTPSSERIVLHTYFILEVKPQFFLLNLVQEREREKVRNEITVNLFTFLAFRDIQSPPRQGLQTPSINELILVSFRGGRGLSFMALPSLVADNGITRLRS